MTPGSAHRSGKAIRIGDHVANPFAIPLLRDLVHSRDRWVFVERGPPIPSS